MSELDVGKGSASRRSRFTPGNRTPDTHWVRDWVDPTTVVDSVETNLLYCRESNPIHRLLVNNNAVPNMNDLCFTVESENETIDSAISLGCSSCLADTEKWCSEERLVRKIGGNARNIKIQASHVNPSFHAHVLLSPQKN